MSFNVNEFINNFMNGIGKISNAQVNNTKEAEKNMQANQQQYLNYTETPDEDPVIDRKTMIHNYKYGIPDGSWNDIPEENTPEPTKIINNFKYGIPDGSWNDEAEIQTDYGIQIKPDPSSGVEKYGIPIAQPDYGIQVPDPTPEPTQPTIVVSMYAMPAYGIQTPEPSPEPTEIVMPLYGMQIKPDPEPTRIVSLYAVPMPTEQPVLKYAVPTIEPTPTQTHTPTPTVTPQPTPVPVRPTNPWSMSVRNIILNLFGGANSSFAQRVMKVFNNFFSRWN